MFSFFLHTTTDLISIVLLQTRQRVYFDSVSCEYFDSVSCEYFDSVSCEYFDSVSCEYEFLYYNNNGFYLKTCVKCKSSEIPMFLMLIQETVC